MSTVQEVPAAAFIPLATAVLVGLLLWIAGRKVLRTSFAAVGFLFGLGLGWLLGEALDFGVPPYVPGILAGAILSVMAVVLYRPALAASMAAVLGVGSPIAVAAAHEWQGQAVFEKREANHDALSSARSALQDAGKLAWIADNKGSNGDNGLPQPLADDEIDPWWEPEKPEVIETVKGNALPFDLVDERIVEPLTKFRKVGEHFAQGLRELWDSTSENVRPALIGACITGALLGFVLGGLFPAFSAAIVTAFGGSLLWLTSARVLTDYAGFGDLAFLPSTGREWLIFWLVIAFIGLTIQWTIGGKRADKP